MSEKPELRLRASVTATYEVDNGVNIRISENGDYVGSIIVGLPYGDCMVRVINSHSALLQACKKVVAASPCRTVAECESVHATVLEAIRAAEPEKPPAWTSRKTFHGMAQEET